MATDDNAPGAPPTYPLLERVWRVFLDPGPLFESLARNPVWAGALLLSVFLVGVSTALIPAEAWDLMFQEQLQSTGQRGVDQPMPEVGPVFRITATLGASVTIVFINAILASFTFVMFVFLLGDEGRFSHHFSVVAHSGLVLSIGGLAILPLKIMNLDPQLALTVGTLFPFIPDGYLYSVLESIDLFGLWAAVLTALGVSKLDRRRSFGSAAAVMIGLTVTFASIIGFFR